MSVDASTGPVGGSGGDEGDEQPPRTNITGRLVDAALAEASNLVAGSDAQRGMKRSATAMQAPPVFDTKVKAQHKAEFKRGLTAARSRFGELWQAEAERCRVARASVTVPKPDFGRVDDFRDLDAALSGHPWRAEIVAAYNDKLSPEHPGRLTAEQAEVEEKPEEKRGKFNTDDPGWQYADAWSLGTFGNARVNADHHFAKHGDEFPFTSVVEYTKAAMAFWFAHRQDPFNQGEKFVAHNYDPKTPDVQAHLVAWDANNKLLSFHTLNQATIARWAPTVEEYLKKAVEEL